MSSTQPVAAAELISGFIRHSPFARHLGIVLERLEPGKAVLSLPFAEHNVTVGDVVHGGATATLMDVAVAAAAFSDLGEGEATHGSTMSLTVDFLRAARGQRLTATARLVRRAGAICFCEIEATDEEGRPVAKALATYKFAGG